MKWSESAAGVLRLYHGSAEVFSASLSEMLWYSNTRPWLYNVPDWECEKPGVYCDGVVCASVLYDSVAGSLKVSFRNISDAPLRSFVAGLSLPLSYQERNKITIPHIIYNDNPSADPDHVIPHIGGIPGKGIVVEEHRLPIPAINAEWRRARGHEYLTLLSFPCVEHGDEDEYWSLGVIKESFGERMLAMSGPVMFNGMKDVAYYGRRTPMPHAKGYRKLGVGEELTKIFYLDWGTTEQGRGFRSLVRLGEKTLKPHSVAEHCYAQMIEFKKSVVDSRVLQNSTCSGYQTFGSANSFGDISRRPDFFLYGWTGQSLKIAWCECFLGVVDPTQRFRLDRGRACVDFFVQRSEGDMPGLLRGYYVVKDDNFQGAWNDSGAPLSSRMQGENVADLIDVLTLFREHDLLVPDDWEGLCRRACGFLMNPAHKTKDGIYPIEWGTEGEVLSQMVTAAGMPCVLALAKAAEYFDDQVMLRYAQNMYRVYAQLHMHTFDRPFARATLDARCEDKEAGIFFFEAAATLYRLSHETCFKQWAEIAADWLLTFVYFWETGFQDGTICKLMRFRTTGWPGVSVQNHHLDVFFPTHSLYAFASSTGNERLMKAALLVSRALTQGVCTKEGEWGYTVIGEQGEHYYQTNYFQLQYPILLEHISRFRGGMQVWNPLWITAQIMFNAIKFHYYEGMP